MNLLGFLVSSYTKEAIELSTKLLEINPEAYTAWNYRKLAVEDNLSRIESDPNLVKSILDEELSVVSFHCKWIWNLNLPSCILLNYAAIYHEWPRFACCYYSEIESLCLLFEVVRLVASHRKKLFPFMSSLLFYESSCSLVAVRSVLNSGRKCSEAEFQVIWCLASSEVGFEQRAFLHWE